MDVLSRPPEADGEAELQGSNVVPVSHRDEQHFPGLQHALQIRSLGKLREAFRVRILHVHLHGRSQKIGNAAYIFTGSAVPYLYGLSIPPDWCCEGAGIDEGTACRRPPGSTVEYICFPPPDVCTDGIPCGKQAAAT